MRKLAVIILDESDHGPNDKHPLSSLPAVEYDKADVVICACHGVLKDRYGKLGPLDAFRGLCRP